MFKVLSVVLLLSSSVTVFASDLFNNPTKDVVRNELWFGGVYGTDQIDSVIEGSYVEKEDLSEEVAVALELLEN